MLLTFWDLPTPGPGAAIGNAVAGPLARSGPECTGALPGPVPANHGRRQVRQDACSLDRSMFQQTVFKAQTAQTWWEYIFNPP
jgi:hypothetical protein